MKPLRSTGFTLIELLVVVAIIVALLAILLPSMGKAMGVAQVAVCASNMRQVGIAGLSYRSDHLMSEPFWRFTNGSGDYPHEAAASGGNPARMLHQRDGVDQGYLPSGEVFFCPTVAMDYETHYGPDTHGDHNDFWGTYTWHYRPLARRNDPFPSLANTGIVWDNPSKTKNVAMVDTPAGHYGLESWFLLSPQFEHYNVLFDDGAVLKIADTAGDFGEFMWGSVGRPY